MYARELVTNKRNEACPRTIFAIDFSVLVRLSVSEALLRLDVEVTEDLLRRMCPGCVHGMSVGEGERGRRPRIYNDLKRKGWEKVTCSIF